MELGASDKLLKWLSLGVNGVLGFLTGMEATLKLLGEARLQGRLLGLG